MEKEVIKIFGKVVNDKNTSRYLNLLKKHHPESYEHSLRVGLLAAYLGYKNSLPIKKIKLLCYAGLLHDIGKIDTPTHILNKKTKLTKNEFNKIKEHPRKGFLRLNKRGFEKVRRIVVMHHEYCDCPYPRKGIERRKTKRSERRAKEFNDLGQILNVADMFDALAHSRAYHKPVDCEQIKKILDKEFKGKKKYIYQVIENVT